MTERIPLSQCTTVLEILYCETRSELKMLVRTSMCELIEAIDFLPAYILSCIKMKLLLCCKKDKILLSNLKTDFSGKAIIAETARKFKARKRLKVMG